MAQTDDRIDRAERRLAARDFAGAHRLALEALAEDRDSAGAWFVLGIIAIEHANPGRAAELFARAAELDPSDVRALAQLGRARLALNDRDGAFASVRRALALDPRDALTLDTLGVTLTRLGDHRSAIDLFERAVALHPASAGFWYNLAASRQFAGRFGAAAEGYRRALDLDPGLVRAWSALVGLETQTEGSNEIPRLTALFEAQTDPDARLHLGHALAKTCEDLGRWDESLDWLDRAKQARRRALAHDPAADRALVDAAMAGARPSGGLDDTRPIFVVGLPRTGTTLVDRILSSHHQVRSLGELTNFALAAKRLAGTPSPRVLDPETLTAAVDAAALGRAYLDSVADLAGEAPRFVDKMPLNVFFAGLIHAALPRARIVCLKREPRDAALSNYRQLFATQFSYYNYAYDLAHTAAYVAGFERLTAHWRAVLPPDRYVEIAYEDLVADQEGQTRRLLTACGLDWDPACLAFQDNAAPVATASSVQVRSPIYASSIGRWRRYSRGLEALTGP